MSEGTCETCGQRVMPAAKGWEGLPAVEIDGKAWPLDFAAKYLGISEPLLREMVKELGLEPAGMIRMASFSRSGRQPRAYRAHHLVLITEAVRDLRQELGPRDPSA